MLTKRQKISLLMEVRRRILDGTDRFIFIAIEQIMSECEGRPYRAGSMPIEKYVPEMLKYKPKGLIYLDGQFELEDKESRIMVIDSTIRDIEEFICSESGEPDFKQE